MKHVTQKDRKHILLLTTHVPSSKFPAHTKCTALRAVKVLTSPQNLPQPLYRQNHHAALLMKSGLKGGATQRHFWCGLNIRFKFI